MIKGIIFDVDGVIINTEHLHFSAFRKLLKKYGYTLTHRDFEKHFSGKSIKGGLISLMEETSVRHEFSPEEFIRIFSQEKIRITKELFKTKLAFFPDTVNFIGHIKNGNASLIGIGRLDENPFLATATGLENTLMEEVLKHNELRGVIRVSVTAEMYGKSKPDPECYQLTLDTMYLLPQEVFGVEDSPSGIRALNAAGITSVGITNTHTKEELCEARIITDSLMKLLDY